jgi:phosphate transport system substrate-binding protein
MIPRRETGNPPGIVNFLQQTVLGGGEWRTDLQVQTDTPHSSALRAIVHQVRQDPAGIGYSGFGFKQPGIRALALAASPHGPFVQGTPASVSDRTYPLTRSLYIAFDPDAIAATDTPLCKYLRYILSPKGQHALLNDPEHFLSLPPPALEASRQSLSTATHGRCH